MTRGEIWPPSLHNRQRRWCVTKKRSGSKRLSLKYVSIPVQRCLRKEWHDCKPNDKPKKEGKMQMDTSSDWSYVIRYFNTTDATDLVSVIVRRITEAVTLFEGELEFPRKQHQNQLSHSAKWGKEFSVRILHQLLKLMTWALWSSSTAYCLKKCHGTVLITHSTKYKRYRIYCIHKSS